ncbi:MAG: class I SAM-dependent methyltransferase [Epsilonproteobacteria bacterium]|nr:class I SAM-dependent methyltransferase [Campylobacterota bacterium]
MNSTLLYYKNNAKDLAKRYESAQMNTMHTLMINTFKIGARLLDIGCGSGRDASFMASNGFNVTAIDASEQMITEAKNHHLELSQDLHVIKLPDGLNFEKESFDGIYSIATLMHLTKEEIDLSLEKIVQLLKPEGKFLFSVSIQRDDVNEYGIDDKGRFFLSLGELEWISICEKYGLKVIKTEVTDDSLDRSGIIWFTCIAVKGF